jgi:hypothetical protein
MTDRTTYDAIRIEYDRFTDIRNIRPGQRPERIRKDEATIVAPLIGWAPYTHHVTIPDEYGDQEHYHAIIPDA